MDIQEYISSGIIETCVMGLASDQEVAELAQLAQKHPEIAAEWQAVQETLGQYAMAHAVTPPTELRNRVLETIHFDELETPSVTPASQDSKPSPVPIVESRPAKEEEKKSASITAATTKDLSPQEKRIPFWPVFSAAASLFLIISIYFNINLSGKLGDARAERDLLISEKQVLASNLDKASLDLADARNNIAILSNKDFDKVTLEGKELSPSSSAGIFYNAATGDVRLAATSLPQPPPGKQYQLWALVNGNPVDLGVFDVSSPDHLTRMKQVKLAQAFAVTLEDAGGKAVPTLDQMYLLGMVG